MAGVLVRLLQENLGVGIFRDELRLLRLELRGPLLQLRLLLHLRILLHHWLGVRLHERLRVDHLQFLLLELLDLLDWLLDRLRLHHLHRLGGLTHQLLLGLGWQALRVLLLQGRLLLLRLECRCSDVDRGRLLLLGLHCLLRLLGRGRWVEHG